MTMIHHYPLDETSGSTTYDYISNNHGSTNAITFGNSGLLNNPVYSFDGSSSYVDLTGVQSLSSFSYGAWIYANNPGDGSADRVIRLTNNNDTFLSITSNGYPEAQIYDGSSSSFATGSNLIPTNEWTHIFETWDGSTLRLYVNGVEEATASVSGNSSAGRGCGIGYDAGSGNGRYFDGYIAEARIYDHTLTPAEVQYLATVPQRATFRSDSKQI